MKKTKLKEYMNTNLTIKVPYQCRHLLSEIKSRGGRFDPDTKTWSVADTQENRQLAEQLATSPPTASATTEERIANVARTTVELLNGLKVGPFALVEASATRVEIVKAPVA